MKQKFYEVDGTLVGVLNAMPKTLLVPFALRMAALCIEISKDAQLRECLPQDINQLLAHILESEIRRTIEAVISGLESAVEETPETPASPETVAKANAELASLLARLQP